MWITLYKTTDDELKVTCHDRYHYYSHKDIEWDKEEAIRTAEGRREERVKKLKKQISELEKLNIRGEINEL